jgi:Dolichyl-phosphate-mannose-protein mannosyltransferase
VLLGLLPAATYALVAYALRPAAPVFAPIRLALVRAALVVAGGAAVAVEALSLVHGLTRSVLVPVWSVAVLAGAAGAALRRRRDRRDGAPAPVRNERRRYSWSERLLALGLLVPLAAELVVALASPPDNYDSQTYHLPKIEHWVAGHDVVFFPTAIHRQVTLAPGAEYLLLHLRLLTGGDALDNLLQFCAGVGCVLLASRIAGQLGGSRRAQLLAGFVVGTAPMVALEATSTQTDLVVAAWVGCLATLVLDASTQGPAPDDELRRRTRIGDLILLGTATGLVTLTKATGLLATGPLLLVWGFAQLRPPSPRALARAAGGTLLILGCVAAVAGPYLCRVDAEFGSPLGPDYLRASVSMERHDPGALLVNALRVGYTALDTPVAAVNDAATRGIDRIARAVGVDPNDPAITFAQTSFPTANGGTLDEDKAPLPVAGGLILLGAGFVLVRPRRRVPAEHAVAARAYAAAFWVNVAVYLTTIKWQPWGNRLILYLVMLGAPLAGLWLDAVLVRARGWRRATATVATLALLAGGCAGWLAVGYGWPRRLVGPHSVFTLTEMEARFQRRPEWRPDFEWAAAAVRASGARRVGLVQGEDTWEYPWWVLLPGRDIVAMQSVLPGLPPARPDQVDALVCQATEEACASFARPGWQVHERDGIGYALPPGR